MSKCANDKLRRQFLNAVMPDYFLNVRYKGEDTQIIRML